MLKYERKTTLASPTVRETTPLEKTNRSENPLGAKDNIGFVGLGRMGTAMAANLAASGACVTAYVRRPDQMQKLEALNLKPTTDFTKLFECSVVISMVSDDDAAREIVFGRSDIGLVGLAKGLTPDAIHLSMSTISTATASQLAGACAARTGLRCSASFWESYCCQGTPVVHYRFRCIGRCRNLPSATRGDWATDLRDRNQSCGCKSFQTAWQHDDGDRTGDARRSRHRDSKARPRSESIHGPYDKYILRRTRP